MNLQKGMNFRCNPNYSVLLMSTRDGAPFEDEIAADGRVLIYEGHNIYKQYTDKDPYKVNQPRNTPKGTLTDNGKFEKAALGLVHTILFALYGKSPTKPFKGENLFTLGKEGIKKYIMSKEVTPEVLDKLVKAGKIEKPEKELAAEYWSNNLSDIKQGTFSRTVMPQTKDAGDTFIAKGETPPDAAAGKVNYIDPKQSDVKENKMKELIRMNQLAGTITEGQARKMIAILNEVEY